MEVELLLTLLLALMPTLKSSTENSFPILETARILGTKMSSSKDAEVTNMIVDNKKKKAIGFSITKKTRGKEITRICKKPAMINPMYFDSDNLLDMDLVW